MKTISAGVKGIWYNRNMFKFWKKMPENKAKDEVVKVAEQQLEENRATIESLRDYDIGKKDIPTSDVERRLRNIQTT